MKLKIDKEFLLKHRFWIMLALVPILWLIASLVLSTAVAGDRDEKRKAYDDQFRGLKGIDRPVNDYFINPLKDKEQRLTAHKRTVWGDVWKSQEDMMTWPYSDRTTPELRLLHWAGRPESEWPSQVRGELMKRREEKRPVGYFGDDIPDEERRDYATSLYESQLKEFEQPPQPVYFLGGWRNIIQPVPRWVSPPTAEECWLAQEDLWVKRELLRTIKAALDAVARMEDVNSFMLVSHSGKEGTLLSREKPVRQVSRNPHWEVELIVELKERKEVEPPPEEKPAEVKDPKAAAKDKPAPEKKPDAEDKKPAPEDKKPEVPENKKPAAEEKKPEAEDKKLPVLALSPKSKLKNVTLDKKPLPAEGLKLRLQQPGAKGGPPVTADLPIDLKQVEAGKPVEIGKLLVLENFNGKEPIEVFLVENKKDSLPKGILARQRLRNPSWELELLLEQIDQGGRKELVISARSTIKNVHAHLRTLNLDGVKFQIKQKDQPPVELKVQGEPLAWGKSVDIGKPVRIATFSTDLANRPFEVEQVLDWSTSPIKRIDEIRLGYHSHRTADNKLVPPKQFASASPAPAPVASSAPVVSSGEGAGVTVANRTPNGLDRDRYYDATGQVRRLPLTLVVVVDQAHRQDMLTAFSNSRLRIQPTQVHWQRIRGVQPYNPDADKEQPKPGDPVKPPVGGGKPIFKPGFKPGGEDGGLIKPGFSGAGPEAAAGGPPEDPNLVQLSIYGISSLYERFPAKAAGSESSAPPVVPVR